MLTKNAFSTRYSKQDFLLKKKNLCRWYLNVGEVKLDCGYRIDLPVEKKVVIELKSVEALNDVHLAQPLTYMKLGNYKLWLLINFNVTLLKTGLKRVVNGL